MSATTRGAVRPTGPIGAHSREAAGAAVAGDGRAATPAPTGSGTPAVDRSVAVELRRMLAAGELDLPRPGAGDTASRWAALAAWGGRDLSLARLAEGHVDALAVLAEAGRSPVPGALYGVWASRAGGAAVRLERRDGARALDGTMRFCSGARLIDRALVVVDGGAGTAPERQLVDVDVRSAGVVPKPGTWSTAAMAEADTLDVDFDDVVVDDDADVGVPGWYVARPGFAWGGAGVAAVWWGGAAGLLDRALGHLGASPDPHTLAHVGEAHAALAATDALLRSTAVAVDAEGDERADDVAFAVATVRGAVERAVREVLERVPRMLGPGPLSRDAALAGAVADLALYVRQHHAERDHAALGRHVVDRWRTA